VRTLRCLLPRLGALALMLAFGLPGAAAGATPGAAVVPGTGAAAVPAAPASGPHVDPNSPAGTEYQLPTDRAREQAAGGGGSTGSSGSSGSPGSPAASGASSGAGGEAPLFGAGVEEKKAPTEKRAGGARAKPRTAGNRSTTADVKPDPGASTPETVRAGAAAPDADGSGLVAVGGGAVGVLLLGALAGLMMRRRARGLARSGETT
jgi:hypothetical protein